MHYVGLGRLAERYADGTRVGHWVYDNPAVDKGLGLVDHAERLIPGGFGLRKAYFYALDGSIYHNNGRGFHVFRSIVCVEQDVYPSGDPQADTDTITRTNFYQKGHPATDGLTA